MTRVVVGGVGRYARSIETYILPDIEIVAYTDNDRKHWNSHICMFREERVCEIRIVPPEELRELEFDYILIASKAYKEMMKQYKELGISEEKMLQAADLSQWSLEQVAMFFDTNILADVTNYKIEGRTAALTEKHSLPVLQRNFPMYDRFVPYLADIEQKKSGETIIDIGANVGDTLMAMFSHTGSRFICVEPDRDYLQKAKENVLMLEGKGRVALECAFVTDDANENYVVDVYADGTARKKACEEGEASEISSKTLIQIIEEREIQLEDVSLVKIDTDGFDADCICSGKKLWAEGQALAFWENDIQTYEQYKKYLEAYRLLEDAGYTMFFCFDNYGNYMGKGNAEWICSVAAYLLRTYMGWSRTTFEYFDVLACKEVDEEKCQKGIEKYLKQFLLQRET